MEGGRRAFPLELPLEPGLQWAAKYARSARAHGTQCMSITCTVRLGQARGPGQSPPPPCPPSTLLES